MRKEFLILYIKNRVNAEIVEMIHKPSLGRKVTGQEFNTSMLKYKINPVTTEMLISMLKIIHLFLQVYSTL